WDLHMARNRERAKHDLNQGAATPRVKKTAASQTIVARGICCHEPRNRDWIGDCGYAHDHRPVCDRSLLPAADPYPHECLGRPSAETKGLEVSLRSSLSLSRSGFPPSPGGCCREFSCW